MEIIAKKIKTIGIVGGMGPLAGLDIHKKIILNTPATKDQDHFNVIHVSFSEIVDRTSSLIKKDDDFILQIVSVINDMDSFKPDCVIIACNTAHARLKEIQSQVKVPIISLIELTGKYIAEQYPEVKVVGILATQGTKESKIYSKVLAAKGVVAIYPSENVMRDCMMPAIYGCIKKNNDLEMAKKMINQVVGELVAGGAEKIIMGCTEVPLIYEMNKTLIDPGIVLARYLNDQ